MSNKDLHRHDLTEEQWSILAPIFEDGSALARLAERIWEMEQCPSAISSVAGRGSPGAHFKRSGKASGFRVVDD